MSAATLNIDEARKELQGFHAYYEKEIAPWMAEQADRQSTARKWAFIVGGIGLLFLPVMIWIFFFALGWEMWALICVGLYAVGVGALALWKLIELKGDIKEFLLDKVTGFFGFKYSEAVTRTNFEQYEKTGLLPGYDRLKLEDEISGTHDGIDFDLMECRLEKKQRDSKGRTTYVNVYHGVLFRMTFQKEFEGQTLVVKDSGKLGNFFKGIGKTGERVKLEDPRFEKQFEVWGTDQVEARYLLTPTFMERVVALAETMGEKRVELCFNGNRLLISVHVSSDQFEGGGIFTSVTDTKRIETLVAELCRIFDIIETLQLTLKTKI